jgi:hypothetical protein
VSVMASPTYSDFAARYLELATTTAAEQTWIGDRLDEEYLNLDAGYWGTDTLRQRAALARVAHRFALYSQSKSGPAKGQSGRRKNKQVGDWSQTWAVSDAPPGSDWQHTRYGVEYLRLRRSRRMASPFVTT